MARPVYKIGNRYQVSIGSGLDSGRIGFMIRSRGHSSDYFQKIEPGRYHTFDSKIEVLLHDTAKDEYFTMFKSRLRECPRRDLVIKTEIKPQNEFNEAEGKQLWVNVYNGDVIIAQPFYRFMPYDPEGKMENDLEGLIDFADVVAEVEAEKYKKGGDNATVKPWFDYRTNA